jgi:hypothetical protein
MSVVTRFVYEKDTGVCHIVCGGNPNTLGLIAPIGSTAVDRVTGALYVSDDSATSSWLTATLT